MGTIKISNMQRTNTLFITKERNLSTQLKNKFKKSFILAYRSVDTLHLEYYKTMATQRKEINNFY